MTQQIVSQFENDTSRADVFEVIDPGFPRQGHHFIYTLNLIYDYTVEDTESYILLFLAGEKDIISEAQNKL